MNEEEGRTPIYFVMGLGDQFSHRVSTDSDDGKRAIVGYLLTNSIPKAAKLFSDKAEGGGDDFIGMSLPFRARFPMMVPDSMEQLMADDPFGNEAL